MLRELVDVTMAVEQGQPGAVVAWPNRRQAVTELGSGIAGGRARSLALSEPVSLPTETLCMNLL